MRSLTLHSAVETNCKSWPTGFRIKHRAIRFQSRRQNQAIVKRKAVALGKLASPPNGSEGIGVNLPARQEKTKHLIYIWHIDLPSTYKLDLINIFEFYNITSGVSLDLRFKRVYIYN